MNTKVNDWKDLLWKKAKNCMREKIIYFHPRGQWNPSRRLRKRSSILARKKSNWTHFQGQIDVINPERQRESNRTFCDTEFSFFTDSVSPSFYVIYYSCFFSFFGLLRFIPAAMIKKERKEEDDQMVISKADGFKKFTQLSVLFRRWNVNPRNGIL